MEKIIHGRNTKFSTATRSKSVKPSDCTERKPLSDLSNFNLIPTETLRKLCSDKLSPSEPRPLLNKSQTLDRSNLGNTANSKSDSKSNTSIGSSNFVNVNNRNAQNRIAAPPRQLRGSSSTNPRDYCSKLAVYSCRRPVVKLQEQKKLDTGFVGSTCVQKTKDEGKPVSVPLGTPSAKKVKHNQNTTAVSFNLVPNEKETSKEKLIPGHLSSIPREKLKHSVKTTAEPPSSTPIENLNNKEKENALPSVSTTVGKTTSKGKAVAVPFVRNEETKDKGKSALLINCPMMNKRKEKSNVDTYASSCTPRQRRRSIRGACDESGDMKLSRALTDPCPLKKKKRFSAEETLPPEFVKQQQAYFAEVDAFELPVEEASYSDLD